VEDPVGQPDRGEQVSQRDESDEQPGDHAQPATLAVDDAGSAAISRTRRTDIVPG